MIDLAKLSERLYHEAEHIADDQPNLAAGHKERHAAGCKRA